MLSVDTSRSLRTHVQLTALVDAVVGAHSHDELDWIEWKGTFDLGESECQGQIARHILGMANRDPDLAGRLVGGCGYILVGVEPGVCRGVTPIDLADLEPQIQRFLGENGPVWQPMWIQRNGQQVLVVIVDPPSRGDPIHTLRRQFDKYDAGDIFVRRHGATHKAKPREIDRLTGRAHAPVDPGRIALELSGKDPVRVVPLDLSSAAFERWLDAERLRLLQPMEDDLTVKRTESLEIGLDEAGSEPMETPEERRRALLGALGDTVAHVSALHRNAVRLSGLVRRPEDREPEDYRGQVERYLAEAAGSLVEIASDRHIKKDLCLVELIVTNPSDLPFREVVIELYIPGEGVRAVEGPLGAELPDAPLIWGDRWEHPFSDFVPTVAPIPHRAWQWTSSPPPIVGPSLRIDNDGSARLTFPPVDMAPRTNMPLDEFHLLVPAEFASGRLEASWTARSILAPGVAEGTLIIEVDERVSDPADLLPSAEEDEG